MMAARDFAPFLLDNVRDTGEVIGMGSYAEVRELEVNGLKCVGKKLHRVLYETARPQERAAVRDRFVQECELLRQLRHPHIVLFLGVWFEQGCEMPVLVMEYLHTTLSACLEKYGVLLEEISYRVLHDVALGLRYLHEHSPPIIHRDLSANNVLLTSDMKAKISDMGVAKILNMTPLQASRVTKKLFCTTSPGTPCYMPPEALTAASQYAASLDTYSFGVLIIHVLCAEWPIPSDAFCFNTNNVLMPVMEVDRREAYLQTIGSEHPLMALIHKCLSNVPRHRPTAAEILNQIDTLQSAMPSSSANRVELLKELTDQKSRADSLQATLDSKMRSLKEVEKTEP